MDAERCKEIIRTRLDQIDRDRIVFPGNDSYYNGKRKGLMEALELVGMIGRQNK